MGRHLWGYWDCVYCSQKKIQGDKDECPSCGASRGENTKFYMDASNIEYVTPVQENDKPNWICSFCNSQNEDYETSCEYCGASKEQSEANYFEQQRRKDISAEESPNDSSNNSYNSLPSRQSYNISNGNASQNIWSSILQYSWLAIVPIAIVLLILLFVWLSTPIQKKITIDSFEWERSISVEVEKTIQESGWNLPSNARLQYEQEEIRDYNKIVDYYETKSREVKKERFVGYEDYVAGYEDLGNGQFEEIIKQRKVYETYYETEYYEEPVYKSVPVYDTKYYYEVDKWVYSRSVNTSGMDKNPYWGEVTLSSDERQGSKKDNYFVYATFEEEQKRYTMDFAEWNAYEIGDTLTVKVNRLTGDIVEIVGIVSSEEVTT